MDMINVSWEDVAERNGRAWTEAEDKLTAIRGYVLGLKLDADDQSVDEVEQALHSVSEDLIKLLDGQ